ncbi:MULTISPECIES: hypothetical protein [Sorangium]|uniref:Secreted protein n=1 Tax=Sorangium cellulosum (strain So ce56) TaxID=448385 RepID=A9GSM7_SORC5|nr:hypothetical protein [Sorangium cellulosum]CAN93802.1 hypothetical protein sce3642 [Sorangium cellulosum So ce56]
MARPPRTSSALPLIAAAAPLLGACGGGDGDAPAIPLADERGGGARVAEIVGDAAWLDPEDEESRRCAVPRARRAHVTGAALVAVDSFDETGEGARGNHYVQDSADEPVPYSGMTIFQPAFDPPDLRLVPGDVVDVLGELTEFLGPSAGRFGGCRTLPELGGTMSFRFEDRPAVPIRVPLDDLGGYASARPYIGMLVRVEGVRITGDPSSRDGRYAASIDVGAGVRPADVPRISNELYDLEREGPPLADGASFRSVTGVLTYFYGFKIAPRCPADFQLEGAPLPSDDACAP